MKKKVQFTFSCDFQAEVLKYLLRDPEGGLVLKRLKPNYFVLIEHSIIAEGIFKYYKKKRRIPSENILKEVIKELLESKNYVDLVTNEDLPEINRIIKSLYSEPLKDSDYIQEKIYQFSTWVDMKNLNDSFDLDNFDQYEAYSQKIDKILRKSKPKKEDEPSFLIRDVVERQFKRQAEPDIVPTPSRQINELTNAGGFARGSVAVLLDKPKARKTFFLVNLAIGYLKMRKSVLYIDTENGQNQIMDRFIQSSLNKTKKEIYSGDFDKLEQRHIRKLSRFGVELVVERVPAMVTDCNYIRDRILKLKSQGIDIKVLVIDYLAKMASISGDKDDFERISNAYIDAQNLAEEMDIDCIWTANHVTRNAYKHRKTRYEENDIAKCVDIIRNSVAIFGLNCTEQEEKDGIQRLQLVVMRDGKPNGYALYKVDIERQRAVEFTKEQRKKYDEIYGETLSNELKKQEKEDKNNSGFGDI